MELSEAAPGGRGDRRNCFLRRLWLQSVISELAKTVMTHSTNTTFGLRLLKAVCLLFCLFSLLDLIPGIYSPESARLGVSVISHGVSRFVSLVDAFLFAAAFYGLQQRSAITWKLGWAFIGVFFSELVIFCLASTLKLQGPNRWIASVAVIVGCASVAIYWSLWWDRQRRHFLAKG
jgi:hypothetical protein